MNERIKELEKQSYTEVMHELGGRYMAFDKEKFAELIVQECADIAVEQKKWVENQQIFNPQDETWNRARIQQSQRIADKIKLHFGVES